MKKTLIIFLISLLLIISISLILAPQIIHNYIVENSIELIGRQVNIEKIKVDYFTTSVRVMDFVIYEENAIDEFVSFDQLLVNLSPWPLINSEFVIEELHLDGLKTHVIQYEANFNFDDLIAHHIDDSQEVEEEIKADSLESEAFKFHLSNLELRNGSFIYTDTAIGNDIAMEDLNLLIPYIGWNQKDASEAGLKFFFSNGGFFQSAFHMDPVSGEFDAEMTLNDLDLSTFYGHAAQSLAIDTLQGSLNTFLKARGNTNDLDRLNIQGWVDLLNLNLNSENGHPLVAVESMHCRIEELQPLMSRFLIDSLIITRPFVAFELYDSTNNLVQLLREEDLQQEEINSGDSAEISYPLYYSVNSFQLNNGEINFQDFTYDDIFVYELNEMEMDVNSITSDADWIELSSTMTLNKNGKLIAELGLDPADPTELDLQLSISDFLLSDLNIYTNNFTGHDIVFGDLYYTSDTKISSGNIVSDNKLTIRDIEINSIEGGIKVLPLKLALFILKDKNGDAVLDVPVRGDLNDPTLTVGKLAWTSFKNMIGKVAAAPYHFLAGLVSADPSDLKSIEYQYADTAFTPKKKRQLDLLLELEEKKEGIDIQLVYFMDREIEKEEIAIYNAGLSFNKVEKKDYKNNKNEFETYLRNKTNNDTISIAQASLIMADPVELDSLCNQFSRYRLYSMKSYLNSQNDSTNIRIRAYKPNAPKNAASAPYFDVKYAVDGEKK